MSPRLGSPRSAPDPSRKLWVEPGPFTGKVVAPARSSLAARRPDHAGPRFPFCCAAAHRSAGHGWSRTRGRRPRAARDRWPERAQGQDQGRKPRAQSCFLPEKSRESKTQCGEARHGSLPQRLQRHIALRREDATREPTQLPFLHENGNADSVEKLPVMRPAPSSTCSLLFLARTAACSRTMTVMVRPRWLLLGSPLGA